MPTTLKSSDPNSITQLDSFFSQFRNEAANSGRAWKLTYEKNELGSSLHIELDPPKEGTEG